jgi:hypothetical protein
VNKHNALKKEKPDEKTVIPSTLQKKIAKLIKDGARKLVLFGFW